jgi:hypothetical protein
MDIYPGIQDHHPDAVKQRYVGIADIFVYGVIQDIRGKIGGQGKERQAENPIGSPSRSTGIQHKTCDNTRHRQGRRHIEDTRNGKNDPQEDRGVEREPFLRVREIIVEEEIDGKDGKDPRIHRRSEYNETVRTHEKSDTEQGILELFLHKAHGLTAEKSAQGANERSNNIARVFYANRGNELCA